MHPTYKINTLKTEEESSVTSDFLEYETRDWRTKLKAWYLL